MAFVLSSQNIFEYLVGYNLCTQEDKDLDRVEPKSAKNFNLLVSLQDGRKLLVKQERYILAGKTAGEFTNEWRIQEFLEHFSELSYFRHWMPKVLHFNAEDSIIVFNYLTDYRDLADFYVKENVFPTAIATTLGTILAIIHRETFQQQQYRDFLAQNGNQASSLRFAQLIRSLDQVTPEVFGLVPADGLKFFALYQRYDSLGQAIAELDSAFAHCCLTHNDLKLNNILLHEDWERSDDSMIRLIDWECCSWGDPALDLGKLIASYLHIWLSSLVISKALSIEESLHLATTPLEQLQPSMAALTKAYLDNFPDILEYRPDFLRRVVQFAGFALIQQIQAMIQYVKSFGNTGIAMLQIAKTLLCRPEQSMPTMFGTCAAELTQHAPFAA